MDMRAYSLVAGTVLAAVSAAVEQAAAAWSRDWGLAAPEVDCRRAWQHGEAAPAWHLRAGAPEAGAWFGWREDAHVRLQHALFAPDRGHGAVGGTAALAAEGAAAAFDALVAALGRALAGQGVEPAPAVPPAALRAGSGAVLARVDIEGCALWILIEHAAVRRIGPLAAAPAGLALPAVDYATLLADQPVRLAVEAGRAKASLGSLLALAPGDVIRLDTLADQPVTAAAPDGTPLLRGYLGTHQHHLALDVVAGGPSSGEQA